MASKQTVHKSTTLGPAAASMETDKISESKETNQASTSCKYIKAIDLLTPQEKVELEKHKETIQEGFEKYSAY